MHVLPQASLPGSGYYELCWKRERGWASAGRVVMRGLLGNLEATCVAGEICSLEVGIPSVGRYGHIAFQIDYPS